MALSLCKHSSALCGHDPECPDLGCEGRPVFPLHRQVMPPEPSPKRDRANALFWTVFVFAIACAAALILFGVEPSLPFQPSEKP